MPYRAWIGSMKRGETSVLKQSFKHLPLRWVIQEVGKDFIVKRWPSIREVIYDQYDPILTQRCEAWDAVWGTLSTGDSQYPVMEEVAILSKKRREVLKEVIANVGISIYDLAKHTNRDYTRVHKDVTLLKEKGLIESRRVSSGENREVASLLPVHSVNRDLAKMAGIIDDPLLTFSRP